jgi:polyhydroxyalkanoic acid synthase PhaR subunit
MSQNPGAINPFDPLDAWRGMRDTYMDTWSKAMIEAVNSDAYAQAMGTFLDSYLSLSAPFRDALQHSMTQVLGQLNMPTGAEVTRLAERLTNIEMRLDDLDAKLDAMQPKAQAVTGRGTRQSSTAKGKE